MKKMKVVLPLIFILTIVLIINFVIFANAQEKILSDRNLTGQIEVLLNEAYSDIFMPEDVSLALKDNNKSLINQLELPRSMGIDIPNINMDRINFTKSINEYGVNGTNYLKKDLLKYGYVTEDIKKLTYQDYKILSRTWPLEKEEIVIARRLYPELKNKDLSIWTKGDFEDYYSAADKSNLQYRFTNEQLQQLEEKGIKIADTFYLFKEFQDADTILSQTDEVLKETIKAYYQFKIDNINKLAEENMMMSTAKSKLFNLIGHTAYAVDPTKYTWVDMPRYGEDWFLNTVVTSSYWMNIQADRTLNMLNALYEIDEDDFSYGDGVNNMYGTYSVTNGGAHEGIDFQHGSTGQDLYAIFEGEVSNDYPTYHLSVYDEDVDKTYIYYHCDSLEVEEGDPVYVEDFVANQGSRGGISTGPHVHFEVHSGTRTSLYSGSDHVLGSISPYQMNIYIGGI